MRSGLFSPRPARSTLSTLSLHDALPISGQGQRVVLVPEGQPEDRRHGEALGPPPAHRARARSGIVGGEIGAQRAEDQAAQDRKSTRLNSSHANTSYAVFCLKKKKR